MLVLHVINSVKVAYPLKVAGREITSGQLNSYAPKVITNIRDKKVLQGNELITTD